jgi:hypothetical protein
MIAWMLYSAVVALVLAAAARAAEWLGRLNGYRVRWIWIGALGLTTFLSASAALRSERKVDPSTVVATAVRAGDVLEIEVDRSWSRTVRERIESLRRSLDAGTKAVGAVVYRKVQPAVDVYAASLAALMSVALCVVLLGVGHRFERARRRWPLTTLQGVDVRVSPRIGPIVIGIVHSEIVVPRWLLARSAIEQRLVVTHESEHVRARDPLLLGLAWCAAVAAPWNPAVWYMVSRLRLAIELDCDARVLRRGAAPESYGSLLIDVAQHASVLRSSALALADDSSHLHQRLIAMKPIVPRFARVRAAGAAAFAFTGVLVACQATLPPRTEIAPTGVSSAAGQSGNDRASDASMALVPGTADTASAVSVMSAPERAAAASMAATPQRAEAAARTSVAGSTATVTTRGASAAAGASTERSASAAVREATPRAAVVADSAPMQRTVVPTTPPTNSADTLPRVPLTAIAAEWPFGPRTFVTPLIFIDGVSASMEELKALPPDEIESVEVVKGAAAELYYGDRRAGVYGVIAITTKRTGGAK